MNKRQYKKFKKKRYCKCYDRLYKEINDMIREIEQRVFDPFVSHCIHGSLPPMTKSQYKYLIHRYSEKYED